MLINHLHKIRKKKNNPSPHTRPNFFLITQYLQNTSGNKRSRLGSILLIVGVLGSDNDAVVANVVALVADDESLGGGNNAKRLVAVRIAECHNGGDARSLGGTEALGSGVDELGALRVA